jgi:hypothetical protein
MRAFVIALVLVAALAEARGRNRFESRIRDLERLPALRQSTGASYHDRTCGLPNGQTFPGFVGSTRIAPNAADTAEVTRGWMADGSDMGITAGTGAKECAWTPPNANDCVRAEVVVGTTTAVPRIVAGSVPESIRTMFSADHTMSFIVNPRDATASRYFFGYGDQNEDGFLISADHGTGRVLASWNGAAANVSVQGPAVDIRGKWAVVTVRKSGTTYTVFVNGVAGTPVTNALAIVNPGTDDTLYLGARESGLSPVNGPFVAWYPASDDWDDTTIKNFSAQVMCAFGSTPSGQSNITNTVSGARYEVMPAEKENLLAYSSQVNQATHYSGLTVTPNAGLDADGKMKADLITSVSAGAYHGTAGSNLITADGVSVYTLSLDIEPISQASSANVLVSLRTGGTTHCQAYNAVPTFNARTSITCTTGVVTAGTVIELRMYPAVGTTGSMLVSKLRIHRGAAGTAGTFVETYADARPAGPFIFPHGDNARWAMNPKGLASYGAVAQLLGFTEQYDNGAWSKARSSITPNVSTVVAPDRTTNSDKLVEDTTATSTHYVSQTLTKAASALPYVLSQVAKAGERTKIQIEAVDTGTLASAQAVCDLSAGTIAAPTGTFTSKSVSIETLGNGWYRCILKFTTDTGTTLNHRTYLHNGASATYTGNGTSGAYLWGANIVQASTESPYCGVSAGSTAASCNADAHTFPAPVGPTTTEGCVKTCITPSHTGSNPFGIQVFYVDPTNSSSTYLLAMSTGSANVDVWNGSGAIPAVPHGFVSGAESCFITDWTAAGNYYRVTNATTGTVGTSQPFTGFPAAFEATWKIGGNFPNGSNNANASVRLVKVGSGPGQCQ